MPTINIRGQGGGGGADGRKPPADVRGAAWDSYQAKLAADEKVNSAAEIQAARERARIERQIQAAWAQRNRQEQAGRRAESELLKREVRASEVEAKNRARGLAEAQRAQAVMDRAERERGRRDQRNADYQARAARSAAEYENRQRDTRNPFKYVRSGIGAIGAGGAAAARGNDPLRAMFSRGHLAYIERNLRRRISAGGPQVAELRKTLESVGNARATMAGGEALAGLEGGALGKAAGWAGLIADVGSRVYDAPNWLAGKEAAALNAAAPYTNLIRGATDLGGGGGFDGRAYSDRLSARKVPAWRRRFGVTAADVLSINSSYGVTARSGAEADAIARDAAAASYAPYLQGLGSDKLASMAGGYRSLGGRGPDTEYYLNLQKAMASAVAIGVDRSKMGEVITRVQGATAAAGGAVNMSTSSDFVARMMAAGNSSMRSGVGILQGQGAVDATISGMGFGGSTMANYALLSHINRNGGLKAMGTRGGLEKLIGRKYDTLKEGEKRVFDNAMAAAKSGTAPITFAHLLAPLMHGDEGHAQMESFAREYATRSGMPKYMSDALVAGILGSNINYESTYAASKGGGQGSLGWGGLSEHMSNSILGAAARHKIDPAILAGLLQQESGIGRNMPWKPRGANGYGQIEISTFNEMKSKGLLSGLGYKDVIDPDKGPEIAAAVYQYKAAQGNGTVDDTLRRYYGNGAHPPINGVRQPTPAEYSASVQGNARRFGFSSNLPADLNANATSGDQAQVEAAKKDKVAADLVGSGIGTAVIQFNGGAASFNKGVAMFVGAATELYRQIHADGPGGGGAFRAPAGPHAMPSRMPVATP